MNYRKKECIWIFHKIYIHRKTKIKTYWWCFFSNEVLPWRDSLYIQIIPSQKIPSLTSTYFCNHPLQLRRKSLKKDLTISNYFVDLKKICRFLSFLVDFRNIYRFETFSDNRFENDWFFLKNSCGYEKYLPVWKTVVDLKIICWFEKYILWIILPGYGTKACQYFFRKAFYFFRFLATHFS